jgi:hypothetical protein
MAEKKAVSPAAVGDKEMADDAHEALERELMLNEEWVMKRAAWAAAGATSAPQSSTSKRVAYVFISSTFNDMHGERDILTRFVFPELNYQLRHRKITVVPIGN